MDKRHVAYGALAGLALTGAVVGTVSAQSLAEETGLTMQQAIEIALMEVPATVQDADLEREDGAALFEIEIVDAEGREFEIEIAADTGTILDVDAEDGGRCDGDKDDA